MQIMTVFFFQIENEITLQNLTLSNLLNKTRQFSFFNRYRLTF